MNSIEKYSIPLNEWEVIHIKNNFDYTLISAGCFQLNPSELIIFGGKKVKSKLERSSEVFKFNVESQELRVSKDKLPEEAEFP